MADGLARCYRCEQVFNAGNNILQESPTETLEEPPQEAPLPEDFILPTSSQSADIESEQEDDITTETAPSAPVESAIKDTQAEIDPAPLAQDSESETPAHSDIPPLSIDELLAPTPVKKRSFLATLTWSLICITLLATATVQLAWFEREKVIQHPEGRRLLEKLCQYADCQVPQLRDLNLIQITQRLIATHPSNTDALLVQLTIKNQAPFSQPFPILELSLLTIDEHLIARRSFLPIEYLNLTKNDAPLMPPNIPQTIKIEIEDPGINVTGFEFKFF